MANGTQLVIVTLPAFVTYFACSALRSATLAALPELSAPATSRSPLDPVSTWMWSIVAQVAGALAAHTWIVMNAVLIAGEFAATEAAGPWSMTSGSTFGGPAVSGTWLPQQVPPLLLPPLLPPLLLPPLLLPP